MRVGQKNKLTYRWARKGSRPRAAHDQRTQSTYLFGAVCPERGAGARGRFSPIDANASSVVALFSGTFAGAWAYRRNIIAVAEFSVLSLFALSLVGGLLIGALLLLWTPII